MMTGFDRMVLAAAALAGAAALAAPAQAADNAMKACGAKYQAAKSAKTLPAGQTWQQFLAQCRGGTKPATTQPASAHPTTTATAPKPAASPGLFGRMLNKMTAPSAAPALARTNSAKSGQETPAMAAMHQRQRQCGQQWKAAKAAGRVPANQTWPQYWSQCNARLKS